MVTLSVLHQTSLLVLTVRMDTNLSAIARALGTRGIQTQLARELGIRQSAVSQWLARESIPARYVVRVEQLTGVSRYDLKPEVFVRDQDAA